MKRFIGINVVCAAALVAAVVWGGPVYALTASQEIVGGTGCGEVTIITTIEYEEALTALGVQVELPEGWVYDSAGGSNVPSVKPARGDQGVIDFAWIGVPAGPVVFSYTLSAPAGGGAGELTGKIPLQGRVRGRGASRHGTWFPGFGVKKIPTGG